MFREVRVQSIVAFYRTVEKYLCPNVIQNVFTGLVRNSIQYFTAHSDPLLQRWFLPWSMQDDFLKKRLLHKATVFIVFYLSPDMLMLEKECAS